MPSPPAKHCSLHRAVYGHNEDDNRAQFGDYEPADPATTPTRR